MTVEPVEKRERFSSGQMEDVSKKGVKRAEEATISANDKYVNEAREGCAQGDAGEVQCKQANKTPEPPPRWQLAPSTSGSEAWS